MTEDNNDRTPDASIKAALNCFLNDERISPLAL